MFNSTPFMSCPEITCLKYVLLTFKCKRLLLFPTGCFPLIILCIFFTGNIQIIIKYYMTDSLNIIQISNFI